MILDQYFHTELPRTKRNNLRARISEIRKDIRKLVQLRGLERALRVLLKLAGVIQAADGGDQRSRQAFLIQSDPVCVLEPFVVFNIINSRSQVAESAGEIGFEDILDQVLEFVAEIVRALVSLGEDLLVNLHLVVRPKRRISGWEFV